LSREGSHVTIQGGIGMSKISAATMSGDELFESVASISRQERAMVFYQKAVWNCDRQIEKMVDKHLETVAESAKKLAEYRKIKARQEQITKSMRERQELNERALIERINYRNLMQSRRLEAQEERRLLGEIS